jgi:hypothetical protein
MSHAEVPPPPPMRPTDLGDIPVTSDDDEIKRLLASVAEGLTDDDPHRPSDIGCGCGPFPDVAAR